MKRLVALMLAVAVCLSVVGVAMADDGYPGKCFHDYDDKEETIIGYETFSSTEHYEVYSIRYRCTKCGSITLSQTKKLWSHMSKDNKTYNYHLDGYHYFYQLCACGTRINQTSAPCPGGNNHIGIMLGLPPVVLEAK